MKQTSVPKSCEALAFNLQGGAAAMGQSSDPQLLRNILRTLSTDMNKNGGVFCWVVMVVVSVFFWGGGVRCRVVVPSTGIFDDLKVQVENGGNSQKMEGCWFDLSSFFQPLCLFLVFGPSAVHHGDCCWTTESFQFLAFRLFQGHHDRRELINTSIHVHTDHTYSPKTSENIRMVEQKTHTICMSRLGYFKTIDGCWTEKDETVLLNWYPKMKSGTLTPKQYNTLHYTHKFNQGRLIPKWILDIIYTMFCHWCAAKDQDGGLRRLSNSFPGEDAHPKETSMYQRSNSTYSTVETIL